MLQSNNGDTHTLETNLKSNLHLNRTNLPILFTSYIKTLKLAMSPERLLTEGSAFRILPSPSSVLTMSSYHEVSRPVLATGPLLKSNSHHKKMVITRIFKAQWPLQNSDSSSEFSP
jgi:hypothetical protein